MSTEEENKRRRSLLARMAGNITSGIEAADLLVDPRQVAQRAVEIAVAILEELEKRP